MTTVKLISWHPDLPTKAAALKARGRTIDSAPLIKTSSVVGELASLNPSVLVLDLDKLPSHCREIAVALRTSKSARHIPILFAGGEPEKITRIRTELPDAHYTSWPEAPHALTDLLKHPSTKPYISLHDKPSTTPLPQKLGIKPDAQIALLAAPDNFEDLLGDLPETTTFTTRLTPDTHLALSFIRSLPDLAATLDLLTLRLPKQASAWIIYPKRTSRHRPDFNENHVRNAALAINLVDYKACSIDSDWSALKFAWRKSPQ
jgi:hypothetical protein